MRTGYSSGGISSGPFKNINRTRSVIPPIPAPQGEQIQLSGVTVTRTTVAHFDDGLKSDVESEVEEKQLGYSAA